VLGDESEEGADPQDDGEEVGEFLRKAQQQVLALDFFEMVRAVLGQSARRLGRVEAVGRAVQAGQRLLGTQGMDTQALNLLNANRVSR
jgi:hypothetical protein